MPLSRCASAQATERASGQLPVGVIGEVYCQQIEQALQQLKLALAHCCSEFLSKPLSMMPSQSLSQPSQISGVAWQLQPGRPSLMTPLQLSSRLLQVSVPGTT